VPLAAAAVTAAVAGWHVAAALGAAEAAAARYGRTVSVLVTRRSLHAGDVLAAADLERRRVPMSLLPDAEPARRAAGRTAAVDLVAGEVVLEERLASSLVPAGWRAVAVTPPGAGAHPPLRAGDVVDVVDVGVDGGATVARDAVVVAVGAGGGVVTVAVPGGDVRAVAYAAAGGTAALAVTGQPRRR
jgi:hypothetical protein